MNIKYPSYTNIQYSITGDFVIFDVLPINHERMKQVHKILNTYCPHDVSKSEIKEILQEIYDSGGLDALDESYNMLEVAYELITKGRSAELKRCAQLQLRLIERYKADWF